MAKPPRLGQKNRARGAGKLILQKTNEMIKAVFKRLVLCNSLQKVTPFQFQLLCPLPLGNVSSQQERRRPAGPADLPQRKLDIKYRTVFAAMLRLGRYSSVTRGEHLTNILACIQCRQCKIQKLIGLEAVGIDCRFVDCQKT